MFRAVDRSPGLHQGLRSCVSVGTLSRDQTSPLSGRLVGSLLLGAGSQAGRPVAPLALSHPRDIDKREEVGSRALADCEVSRHDHRYRGPQGFSISGESREIPDGCGELLYHGRSPSSALAGDPRSPGFARAAGSSRSSSDAHFTVASEGALVPESDPPSLPVLLPREMRRDLSWWMVKDHLLTGVRFGTPAPDLHLYSDASCSVWGAYLLDQHVSGVWSDREKLLHINLLEMKAHFLGPQAFREDVIGHHVTTMLLRSFSRSVNPVELRPPAWDVALVLQSLTGAPYEPLWTCDERFLAQKTLLPQLSVLVSSMLCRIVCLIPGAGLRFPFLSSRASWQRLGIPLPLLLGLRALLYRPYQTREIIAMGDCYVLCGRSGVTLTALLHMVRVVSGCLSSQGVARRRYRRPLSPSGSGRQYHVPTSSRVRKSLFLPLELRRLVVFLRLFFSRRTSLSTRC